MALDHVGTFRIGGDLPVRRLGFGAMRITGDGIWGEPPDREEAMRLLRRVVELGIDFIDTADSYGPDVSELLIAEALHPYPPGLVIATKGGSIRAGPRQWARQGDPAHLRSVCEGSLQKLRLERIDLYQLHAPDPKVPIEDSLGALVDLQREGKIRHIGVSNFDVPQLNRARKITSIATVQNRYNLADRSSQDVLDFCEQHGIGFIPWRPLGIDGLEEGPLASIAGNHRCTQSQIALAWLLGRSPVMLPIPGTSSIRHLESNVEASSIRLSADEKRILDDLA